MSDIYDIRRYGKIAFLIASASVVALFLYFSDGLIRDLSKVERERMQLWADATRELAAVSMGEGEMTDIDVLLGIIQSNTTIPVLLTDDEDHRLNQRNFTLPVEEDDAEFGIPTDERNVEFLNRRLLAMKSGPNKIEREIGEGMVQYLYYEDSTLLKRISIFP